MDTAKFKGIISKFIDADTLSVNLDFIIKGSGCFKHYSTEPDDELKERIIKAFTSKLASYAVLDDFKIDDIYDDNASAAEYVFHYDKLAKNSTAKDVFTYKNDDKEVFDFKENSLTELFGIIIELDNGSEKIRIFKKVYPILVVKKHTSLNFFANQANLKLFKNDLFQLNNKIHLIATDDTVVIVAKKVYTDHFGFKEQLKKDSEANLTMLNGVGSFEINPKLWDRVGNLPQVYQKKLKNCVENSPILKDGDFSKFQQQALDYGKREIKMTDAGFFNIKAKKDLTLLIDFLNRDFNKNEVTGEVFKTPSKKLVKK